MLEFLENYYVCMLILLVVSYLVPKEEYKAYIQFFIGIFVIVLFLKPILEFCTTDNSALVSQVFEEFNIQLQQYKMDFEEEETIFEHFFFKGE